MTHKEVMVRKNILISARCATALKKVKRRHPLKKSESGLLEEAFWRTFTDPIERQHDLVKEMAKKLEHEKKRLEEMKEGFV